METHLKNTWEWDKWGFTEDWGNCTMSDIDGFVPFFAERRGKFLLVEMKHWDGNGDVPAIKMNSGQAIALWELSKQDGFSIILGYGDTSVRKVYYHEVWTGGNIFNQEQDFKTTLNNWFRMASNK